MKLTRRLIWATLIPLEMLKRIRDDLKLEGMRKAIPLSQIMTFKGLEIVDSKVISAKGIIVLVNTTSSH